MNARGPFGHRDATVMGRKHLILALLMAAVAIAAAVAIISEESEDSEALSSSYIYYYIHDPDNRIIVDLNNSGALGPYGSKANDDFHYKVPASKTIKLSTSYNKFYRWLQVCDADDYTGYHYNNPQTISGDAGYKYDIWMLYYDVAYEPTESKFATYAMLKTSCATSFTVGGTIIGEDSHFVYYKVDKGADIPISANNASATITKWHQKNYETNGHDSFTGASGSIDSTKSTVYFLTPQYSYETQSYFSVTPSTYDAILGTTVTVTASSKVDPAVLTWQVTDPNGAVTTLSEYEGCKKISYRINSGTGTYTFKATQTGPNNHSATAIDVSEGEATTHTVKFRINSGTTSGENERRVNHGNSIELPVTMYSEEGKYLSGWTYGSATYTPGESIHIYSDMTFTAEWTDIGVAEDRLIRVTIMPNETWTLEMRLSEINENSPQAWAPMEMVLNTFSYAEIGMDAESWVSAVKNSSESSTITIRPYSPGIYFAEFYPTGGGLVDAYSEYAKFTIMITVPAAIDEMHTVTFYRYGEAGGPYSQKVGTEEGYTGAVVTLPGKLTSTDGRVHTGWSFRWHNQGAVWTAPLNSEITIDGSDLIVWANWTSEQYVAVIDGTGLINANIQTFITKNGDYLTLPSENSFTKVGYTFGGWRNTEGTNYVYAPGCMLEVNGPIYITAYFVSNLDTKYTVTFSPGEGTGIPLTAIVEDGTNVMTPKKGFNREGYTFRGWGIAGDTVPRYGDVVTVTSDITLVPIWEAQQPEDHPDVVVSFNLNGGPGSIGDQIIKYGGKAMQPDEPMRDMYKFIAWQLDGETFDFNTSLTSNVTLFAKWAQVIEREYTGASTVHMNLKSPFDGSTATVYWGDGQVDTMAPSITHTYTINYAGNVIIEVRDGNLGTFLTRVYVAVDGAPVYIQPTGIAISETSKTINAGTVATLTATISPEDATDKRVIWETSNREVATVNDGVVTGIMAGTATITAYTHDRLHSATCTVTVQAPTEGMPDTITIRNTKVQMYPGDIYDLIPVVRPSSANQTVTWVSSDPNIATVSDGVITSIAVGTVTVMGTTVNGLNAMCLVSVIEAGTPMAIELVMEGDTISINAGASADLTVRVIPDDAVTDLEWSTSNPEVVTVYNGRITAISPGTAIISVRATASSLAPATCTVLVQDDIQPTQYTVKISASTMKLDVGESKSLGATVTPRSNHAIIWDSQDTGVATVDSNGKVTAIAVGTTVITASCEDATASCIVTVQDTDSGSIIDDTTTFVKDNLTIVAAAIGAICAVAIAVFVLYSRGMIF